jgi:predicted ferric reductase
MVLPSLAPASAGNGRASAGSDRARAGSDRARAGKGRAPGRPIRLSGRGIVVAAALVGLAIVLATDQIVPASSAHQAQLRVWLASRAAGLVALVLLAFQVVVGLLISHPENKATWKLSKTLFPWHEHVWLFVLAFLATHVVSIAIDPFAGVGIGGVVVPGLSEYRSAPVAVGTIALYALLVTGLTARFTRLLPGGAWLTIHRLALGVFGLAWVHAVAAGTDSVALVAVYVALGGMVLAAAAYRYWVSRVRRPGHASSPAEMSR